MSVSTVVTGGLWRLPFSRWRCRWGVWKPAANLILRKKRESTTEFFQLSAAFMTVTAKGDPAGGGGDGGAAEGTLTTTAEEDTRRWWHHALYTAASLYPLYVTVGGLVACIKPSAFSFFVERGPTSYRLALAFIMLATGLTIELRDLADVLIRQPLSVSSSLFVVSGTGCAGRSRDSFFAHCCFFWVFTSATFCIYFVNSV